MNLLDPACMYALRLFKKSVNIADFCGLNVAYIFFPLNSVEIYTGGELLTIIQVE